METLSKAKDQPEDYVPWEAQRIHHSQRLLRMHYREGYLHHRKYRLSLKTEPQSWRVVAELGSLIAMGMMGSTQVTESNYKCLTVRSQEDTITIMNCSIRGAAKGARSAGIVERVYNSWYPNAQMCRQQRY